MHTFVQPIRKYSSKGEKTGWTYVDIPDDIIRKLKLESKKGFRIRGMMDNVRFQKLSTYPVGEGRFIIAINAAMRKKLGKKEGAMLSVKFEKDSPKAPQSKELLLALKDDAIALKQFKSQLLSHQNYFHRYIETAKGADTKAGRIVNVINAMYRRQDFGQMIRSLKGKALVIAGAIFLMFLTACSSYRSFIPPGLDPVTVRSKGDVEVNLAMRPRGFYRASLTAAVSESMAVRVGWDGFAGSFDNFNCAALGYKFRGRYALHLGPGYNYQRNILKHSWSLWMTNTTRTEVFNSEYHTPFLFTAASLGMGEQGALQLMVRPAYNIVRRHGYSLHYADMHGSYFIEHAMDMKVRNFLSLDAGLACFVRLRRGGHFHFGGGLSFVQKVHREVYTNLYQSSSGLYYLPRPAIHPTTLLYNFSIGLNLPLRQGNTEQ